ncbi:hypothetical protein [Novosphingobium sp.]|uniref:hypothetical protein n=1 Tax=Novosphingobium sp. TaxID=1874826 RepID=UPI0031D82064
MDLTELLKGSLPTITAQFANLSDDDIVQLIALEATAAKPRSGLLASLKTEQQARGGDGTARDENDALIAAEAQVAELTALNAGLTDANTALSAQVEDLQGQVATLTTSNASLTAATADTDALREQIEELQLQLSDMGVPASVGTVDGKTVVLIVGGSLDGLTRVVFADATDHLLEQIPALQFPASVLVKGDDGTVVLNAPISFPRFGPTSDVSSAWLVGDATDEGLAGAVCRLVIPVGVGGGRAVELPAGHLRFSLNA